MQMNKQPDFRVRLLAQLVLSAMLAAGAETSFAQDAVDLGTVQSTADDSSVTNSPASAP